MNKLKKSILAILGGCDVVIYVSTPIILAILWSLTLGFESYGAYVVYITGMCASVFRGIKIGWIRKND